jgi:hypothetical protein
LHRSSSLHSSAHESISLLRGGNTSTASSPNPVSKRRDLIAAAILVDHPEEGLILFETGCAEDIDVVRVFSMESEFPNAAFTDDISEVGPAVN